MITGSTAEDVTGVTDGGATITVKLMGSDPDGDSIIYARNLTRV